MVSPGPYHEDRLPYRTKYKNRLRLYMWSFAAGGAIGFLLAVFTFTSGLPLLPIMGLGLMVGCAYGFEHYRQKLKGR